MHAHGGARKALALALALVAGFAVVEALAGLVAGSVALLADAAHMLSDGLALGLALFAAWLALRPATPERSFGWRRAEVLAALANASCSSCWASGSSGSRSAGSPILPR